MSKARDLADLGNKTSLGEINDAYDAGALSNRNVVTNGSMAISQRGNSFTHTNVGTGTFYCLDRFKMQSDLPAMAYTVTQAQDGPSGTGLVNSFKVTVNTPASSFPDSGNRYFRVRHSIEGQNVKHLAAKACTLSFWVKSSVAGQFDVAMYAPDITGNNHFVAPYTIHSADTWEKKEISLTGPAVIDNNNTAGLDIQFQIAKAGTAYQTSSTGVWGPTNLSSTGSTSAVATTANATWQITGVQLEVGPATPFEHRSYGQELAACQRYYFVNDPDDLGTYMAKGAYTGNQTTAIHVVNFPTTMRASPTLGSYTISQVTGMTTVAGVGFCRFTGSASASDSIAKITSPVAFDAEL